MKTQLATGKLSFSYISDKQLLVPPDGRTILCLPRKIGNVNTKKVRYNKLSKLKME